MSMPYRIISCSRCDLYETSLNMYGFFVWRDPQNREFHIDRELGICRDCRTVTPIERLPDHDEFDEAEEAFLSGFWRKRSLRKKIYRSFWKDSLIEKALDPESGYEVLRAVMALKRTPVCLVCGSSSVSTMPIPYGHNPSSEDPVPTGTIHPGCGGELIISGSGGERIAMSRYKNVYSLEGQLIDRTPA
jgi:hypothetical protein